MSRVPRFTGLAGAALALLVNQVALQPMFDPEGEAGAIRIPKHKPRTAPSPTPNPKAERRKMLKVRAMRERKQRQRDGLK